MSLRLTGVFRGSRCLQGYQVSSKLADVFHGDRCVFHVALCYLKIELVYFSEKNINENKKYQIIRVYDCICVYRYGRVCLFLS